MISIYLPPLRERKEDIPALVRYFVEKFSRELGKDVRAIDEAALHKLVRYGWPGNVRELENCLKRAVVLSKGDLLTAEDVQIQGTEKKERGRKEEASLEEMLDQVLDLASITEDESEMIPLLEKVLIRKALQKTGGNQVRAARLLGISRNTLRSRMKKYRIAKEVEITRG
ncbi:MAG: Nitrogen regulation protein NR(I) [Actinobacteria bacterium]|nr:Nitrogen regulation protein NR(I) [Actinomycetota bacterium]